MIKYAIYRGNSIESICATLLMNFLQVDLSKITTKEHSITITFVKLSALGKPLRIPRTCLCKLMSTFMKWVLLSNECHENTKRFVYSANLNNFEEPNSKYNFFCELWLWIHAKCIKCIQCISVQCTMPYNITAVYDVAV